MEPAIVKAARPPSLPGQPACSVVTDDDDDEGNDRRSRRSGGGDRMQTVVRSQNELDLNTTIQEASVALKLFFTNHFAEARDRMKPFADCSMYHSLGYGTILYIQAVMTFDMGDIEQAIAAMKRSVIVSSKMRRRSTLLGSIAKVTSGVNYNEFTEEEVHAEICYTESLLIRALLTFIQDENLISFVKGGFKIRECYKIYKSVGSLRVST